MLIHYNTFILFFIVLEITLFYKNNKCSKKLNSYHNSRSSSTKSITSASSVFLFGVGFLVSFFCCFVDLKSTGK